MRKKIALLVLIAGAAPVGVRGTAISFTGTKTVGVAPPPACASTSTITVAPGTKVYYCYTLTPDANVTLPYALVDDQLGVVTASGATTGGIGRDFASATVTAPVTNVAFWETSVENGTIFANATATVNVGSEVPALAPPVLIVLGFALLFAGLVLLRRIG